MLKTHVEYIYYMLVIQHVKRHFPLATIADEPHGLKETQVMRYERFRQAQEVRDVADAELLVREGVEYLQARGVAYYLQRLREAEKVLLRLHEGANGIHLAGVNALDLADIARFLLFRLGEYGGFHGRSNS